jgi:hypothetical protein
MRRTIAFLPFLAAVLAAVPAKPQQVVDRVAARIEDDLILESEVRELGQYQRLVDGREEAVSQRLDRLIDQWIVRSEARAALFPRPADAEVDAELARLRGSLPADEFEKRLTESGLSKSALRRIVAEQLYLTRYLDSRFRAAVQVDQGAVRAYYRDEFTPQAEKAGAPVPPLAEVRGQIREILIQRGISQQAARWLDESRSRLHIERELQ